MDKKRRWGLRVRTWNRTKGVVRESKRSSELLQIKMVYWLS